MNSTPLKHISARQIEAVAALFKSLGEESRLQILRALNHGEKNVTLLAQLTGLSQPNVSRHLSVLLAARVIQRRKDGANVLYRSQHEALSTLVATALEITAN